MLKRERAKPQGSTVKQAVSQVPKQRCIPHCMGGVNRVNMQHGDVCWEEDVDWELIEDELGDFEHDFYGERPPNLSPEELNELDAEVMKVEIEKLTAMGVVQTLKEQVHRPQKGVRLEVQRRQVEEAM